MTDFKLREVKPPAFEPKDFGVRLATILSDVCPRAECRNALTCRTVAHIILFLQENFDIRSVINRITNAAFEALPDVQLPHGQGGDESWDDGGRLRFKVFDPQPFISMIDDSVMDLEDLRDDNDTRVLALSSECKVS